MNHILALQKKITKANKSRTNSDRKKFQWKQRKNGHEKKQNWSKEKSRH